MELKRKISIFAVIKGKSCTPEKILHHIMLIAKEL